MAKPQRSRAHDDELLPPAVLAIAAARLRASIDTSRGPEACWPWTRGGDWPHLVLAVAPGVHRVVSATHLVWLLSTGAPPPPGRLIGRACGRGGSHACLNPAHLVLGP